MLHFVIKSRIIRNNSVNEVTFYGGWMMKKTGKAVLMLLGVCTAVVILGRYVVVPLLVMLPH